MTTDHDAFSEAEATVQARIDRLLAVKGSEDAARSSTASSAQLLWDDVGMARNEAGLQEGPRRDPARCARSSGRTCRCRATRTT